MAKKQYTSILKQSNYLSMHTKALVRRAHSCCELCQAKKVKLNVFQVSKQITTSEASIDDCIFICEACSEQINKPLKKRQTSHWHCLYKSIWSNVVVVQAMAVHILREMAASEHWAAELLDNTHLLPEVVERLEEFSR